MSYDNGGEMGEGRERKKNAWSLLLPNFLPIFLINFQKNQK
jgi:hypothetical protein